MAQQEQDHRALKMEQIMGNLLRSGVLLAALTVLLGGILHLYEHGRSKADYRAFRGEPSDLRHPVEIISGALAGHSRSVIQLGILLLIATPVLRVGFSVVGFLWERDLQYVGMTLVVLVVLLYSLFLAHF